MNLKNTNEPLNAQELELVNDFQMEELEERMEMKSWFSDDAGQTTIGVGNPGGVPPETTTPPPSAPQNPNTGTAPVGGVIIKL